MYVLLIDDDPDARKLFQMAMDHHKYPHQIAENARIGINHLETSDRDPDIVLMDIFLPDIDGYKTLTKIRQAGLIPNARIVATTAYYTNDTQQEVLERGFDGFVTKPFEMSNLVSYLESLLA